jgi:hypothetical protein
LSKEPSANDSEIRWQQVMKVGPRYFPVRWVEGSLFEFGPMFATTFGLGTKGPITDSLFVVAELAQHCCMFGKHHLEGWCMAGNLICQDLEMPLSQELLQAALKVWTYGPGGAQS